jgi:hypothetical protein
MPLLSSLALTMSDTQPMHQSPLSPSRNRSFPLVVPLPPSHVMTFLPVSQLSLYLSFLLRGLGVLSLRVRGGRALGYELEPMTGRRRVDVRWIVRFVWIASFSLAGARVLLSDELCLGPERCCWRALRGRWALERFL